MIKQQLNIFGKELQLCCNKPKTGFFRTGFCQTASEDHGTHVICAKMTQEFLNFTLQQGNDLITPRPQYNFPGLQPGDYWCLCVLRWKQAMDVGVAPPLKLQACNIKALDYVPLEDLLQYECQDDE